MQSKKLLISKFVCSLQHTQKRFYQTLSPEDYLFNQRDSALSNASKNQILKPLPNSNHGEGTTDEVNLVGIPYGQTKDRYEDYDTFKSSIKRNHPDVMFLQLDPSAYIARQRFLSHKCALKDVEDYHVAGMENIDPHKPFTWEECVVNLVGLDMLHRNKVHSEFTFESGLAAYSYEHLQDKAIQEQNKEVFIKSIGQNIINKQYSPYYMINQALYTALMGKQKVLLGDMPETLLRQIVGNSLEIEELRDLFKFILQKMKEIKTPISMRDATLTFLPHIFQQPRDLYMTAMLKETFQAATCIVAMVGMPHYNPIKQYWVGAPNGINYSEATYIPDRIRGETDDKLIEKQAIMDVLLETRAWGAKYIANPFPYLETDINKINSKEFELMKKCFQVNVNKYTQFKKLTIADIPDYKNPTYLTGQVIHKIRNEMEDLKLKKPQLETKSGQEQMKIELKQ